MTSNLRRIKIGGEAAADGRLVTLAAIGPPGVGKTSMLARVQDPGVFSSQANSTAGVDMFSVYATLKHENKDTAVKLLMRDLAGQDKFTAMLPAFARNIDGVFVMFDSTNRDSLAPAMHWMREFRKNNTYAVCMLVATKIDLFETSEQKPFYTLDEMQQLAGDNECLAGFAEISSLSTKNLERAVNQLAELAYAERSKTDSLAMSDDRASIIVVKHARVNEKKRCDC